LLVVASQNSMGKFAIHVLRVSSIAIALLTLSSCALTYKLCHSVDIYGVSSLVCNTEYACGVHFGSAAYAKRQYDTVPQRSGELEEYVIASCSSPDHTRPGTSAGGRTGLCNCTEKWYGQISWPLVVADFADHGTT
jgi:hypothetical protein